MPKLTYQPITPSGQLTGSAQTLTYPCPTTATQTQTLPVKVSASGMRVTISQAPFQTTWAAGGWIEISFTVVAIPPPPSPAPPMPVSQSPSSCLAIRWASPGSPSGWYWIKPGATTIYAYCDMTTDGGGYTMYPCMGCTSTNLATAANGCTALGGMNIVVPRTRAHWSSLISLVQDRLSSTVGTYMYVPTVDESRSCTSEMRLLQ